MDTVTVIALAKFILTEAPDLFKSLKEIILKFVDANAGTLNREEIIREISNDNHEAVDEAIDAKIAATWPRL